MSVVDMGCALSIMAASSTSSFNQCLGKSDETKALVCHRVNPEGIVPTNMELVEVFRHLKEVCPSYGDLLARWCDGDEYPSLLKNRLTEIDSQ